MGEATEERGRRKGGREEKDERSREGGEEEIKGLKLFSCGGNHFP